ncbi:MAG: T9SS type A sorting domain-containing protein [Saprospiraceae bacterium]
MIKIYFAFLILLSSLTKDYAQCNITPSENFTDYRVSPVHGLIIQGAVVNGGSIYGSNAGLLFHSILTTANITTATYETGELSELIVHPNPVSSTLYLDWKNIHLDCNLELYSVLGQKLIQSTRGSREYTTSINMETLGSGIYLLKIISKNNQYIITHKIIKP